MNQASVKAFIDFIIERHAVYLKKTAGSSRPWTTDPILQKYKFCNVYRELDRTTVWIAEHWRKPHEEDPDLWFAMLVARLINWPPTLNELGYPVPWNPKYFAKIINARKARGEKIYSNAYMLTTSGEAIDKTALNLRRFTALWKDREEMRPIPTECLWLYWEHLCDQHGIGSFIAAQIIADMKYARPFLQAPDWWTFAAPGPGSRRGMNRLLVGGTVEAKALNKQLPFTVWTKHLCELRDVVNSALPKTMGPLHAQDLQNCLCEFDKYQRIQNPIKLSLLKLYKGGSEE